VYIGQATFLPVLSVAAMIGLEGMENLESVRLVDVYEGSIWGRRMRRGDVEQAAAAVVSSKLQARIRKEHDLKPFMFQDGSAEAEEEAELVGRIREIVVCEVRTERFMGGDRASEGSTILV
jgi:hypothetical protein